MKKIFTLIAVAAMAVSANAQDIFTATVTATNVVAFAPGETEITSDWADIVGGKMVAISEQTSDKNLIAKQNGKFYFCMTNNNTYFKLELDNALAAGDVISAVTYSRTDTNLGLFLSTASSRPNECNTALTISQVETAAEEPFESYTVAEGDGIEGATTLYIYRQTGKSTYFKDFKITRPELDPTGISSVTKQQQDGVVYNLAGQRVQNVQKGLYIQNGKKYVK